MVDGPTQNRTYPRYFKICPRGFAIEAIYLRINNASEAEQCEREYSDLEDLCQNRNAYCEWTDEKRAEMPGVAIDWVDCRLDWFR